MPEDDRCDWETLSPEDVPMPFAVLGPDGRVQSCNSALLELAGFAGESPGNMPPQPNLIPPEWRPGQAGAEGDTGPRHFPAELATRDMTPVRVEAFVRRTDDEKGRPCRFLVNVLDADALRSMGEAELVRAEQKASLVASLLDEVRSPIFATDERSRIVYANADAWRLFGRPYSEITGTDLWFAYPISQTDLFYRIYQRALHEGRSLTADHYSQKLNTWYEVRFYPRKGGGLVVIMNNVTARKQYERFMGLAAYTVNRLSDYVLWLDDRGRITKANDIAYENLRFPGDQKAYVSVSVVTDITLDAWAKIWREIEDRGSTTLKARLYGRDGDTIPVEASVSHIRYVGQEHGIVIARDISDRIKAEQDITRAREQAELYLDLMSHDIRNMNQVGQGYLELALEDPNLSKDEKELLEKPLEAFHRSSELISNVKILKKAGLSSPFEKTDLADMLREVAAQYSSAQGRDLSIELSAMEACHVMANPLLKEVFANLVSNAIKHSGGRISIWITLRKVMVADRLCCEAVIEDDGPGVPDEVKEKLFNTKLRDKGGRLRGLGLVIVKSLLDDFHGAIAVEDRVPGDFAKGARFVVILPTAQ